MWLTLTIILCACCLLGLLVFLGVPDMLLRPPVVETYAPAPTAAISVSPKQAPVAPPVVRISEFATIDRYALDCPPSLENKVPDLSRYLKGATRNDREMIRAIYRWVCDRIAYDGPAYRDHLFPDTDGNFTLKRKRPSVVAMHNWSMSLVSRPG